MNLLNEIISTDNSVEKNYSKKTSLEHRKKFAQFFTPYSVAKLMTNWLLNNQNLKTVLEPAFGLGVFSRALLSMKENLNIKGFEVDKKIYSESDSLFANQDNVIIELKDYMYNDWENKYDGIICNPPYFKFHNYDNKIIIKEVENRLQIRLNGLTNLYTLFLLKSIYQLENNGRLAYIIPSEFLNSDYGKLVKLSLIKSKILRHIIVFNFNENVFEDALTTACIILCSNDNNFQKVNFTTIQKLEEINKIEKYINEYPDFEITSNTYPLNELIPDVKWRRYYQKQNSLAYKNLVPFTNVAKVVRGIATGANNYFTFSKSKASKYKIEQDSLLPCICKSTDVKSNFFTKNDFNNLKENDKLIYLFDGQATSNKYVQKYIDLGEEQEVNKKYLTSCRKPWYSLENRPPSPIWVSVFNRSGLRFIRNEAQVYNLTTFHCIYPVKSDLFNSIDVNLLFAYLLTDVAKEIFEDNRREYGNGLQKFEPNDINKSMMLDLSILNEDTKNKILRLFYQYRESVINSSPDQTYLNLINEIFKSHYARH